MATLQELKQDAPKTLAPPKVTFSPEEAQYLLNLIARSDFKGADIQVVYNIALKLQETIIEKNKING